MKEKKKFDLKKIKFEYKIFICALTILVALACAVLIRRNILFSNPKAITLTDQQTEYLTQVIADKNFERNQTIHNLPYDIKQADLEIFAESAILINCDTGDILYEKNADEEIPPASMTKLFLMYTVFQKLSEGKASLDDIVPLPPECWASHMPPHSSLMFLGKNQTVTLRELLTGLAVCSGNDASHAIAYYLFGGIDSFLEEVNQQIKLCGLEKTRIVEPSGYSENNVTTAREMAKFARIYISRYPESLKQFHSVKKFAYPSILNIAPEDRNKPSQIFNGSFPDSIWTTIEQENTNKCLKTLEGCDGLKTGYIDESGYNLSLTCIREGQRYLSVTMKGPGDNVFEGDKYRVQDGTTLQNYAFQSFVETRDISEKEVSVTVPVLGGKEDYVNLFVPFDMKTCIPLNLFNDKEITIKLYNAPALFGQIKAGEQYGKAALIIDGYIIEEAPLIADRDIKKSFIFKTFLDRIIYQTIRKK